MMRIDGVEGSETSAAERMRSAALKVTAWPTIAIFAKFLSLALRTRTVVELSYTH